MFLRNLIVYNRIKRLKGGQDKQPIQTENYLIFVISHDLIRSQRIEIPRIEYSGLKYRIEAMPLQWVIVKERSVFSAENHIAFLQC